MNPEKYQSPEDQEKKFLAPERLFFNRNRNTLLLAIDKDVVDVGDLEEIASQHDLQKKDEFHITVLGSKNGGEIKKILESMPAAEKQSAIARIKSLIGDTDWSFALEPERYHITKEYVTPDPKGTNAETREHRESYIQMVSVPEIKIFYDALNSILGSSLEAPPTHITLFTGGDNKEKSKVGIGINTQEEFEKLNPLLIQR